MAKFADLVSRTVKAAGSIVVGGSRILSTDNVGTLASRV
jgi:hypothetical protein